MCQRKAFKHFALGGVDCSSSSHCQAEAVMTFVDEAAVYASSEDDLMTLLGILSVGSAKMLEVQPEALPIH